MIAKIYPDLKVSAVAEALLAGKIGVIPTDTIYGIVCRAEDEAAVERLYAARQRDDSKQCIVLAASIEQMLDIDGLDRNTILMAERLWPGPISVVVPCKKSTLQYVHRGNGENAWRIPNEPVLLELLRKTGPLIAPSANLQDKPPATTIEEAQQYFGDLVDFYVSGGTIKALRPSTLVKFTEDGLVQTLRQGAVTVTEDGRIA